MQEKTLGRLPLSTWNWLGVNEVKIFGSVENRTFVISKGETQQILCTNFSEENRSSKIDISVEKSARVELIAIDLGFGNFSSSIEIDLQGDESTAKILAIYFGCRSRKLDFNYVIHQRGLKTSANIEAHGVLTQNCDKIFRSTLDFQNGAKGSAGNEFEEVLVFSENARNRSVPLMLSNEDEVNGHHAVNIGRIDEEKIFYLMSRGLDKFMTEQLIMEASFNPIIEKISDQDVKNKVLEVLRGRINGERFFE